MNAALRSERSREAVAELVEIFSGVQGEGTLVGERQIFIRFAGCNLRCRFCDTPTARAPSARFRAEQTPGRRDFESLANPAAIDDLLALVIRLHEPKSLHGSVSITGGEPLMQADAVAALLPGIRAAGLQTYLESNGTLPEALAVVIEDLDYVSMDVKLPSATRQAPQWDAHRQFLTVCRDRRPDGLALIVKAVVTDATPMSEIEQAAALVAETAPGAALVLQPVTPMEGIRAPGPGLVLAMQAAAKERVADVRVIPQVHKFIGQR